MGRKNKHKLTPILDRVIRNLHKSCCLIDSAVSPAFSLDLMIEENKVTSRYGLRTIISLEQEISRITRTFVMLLPAPILRVVRKEEIL